MAEKSEDILDELCREGKRITVCLEIIDKEKAINLLNTMYTHGKETEDKVGVSVYLWSHFDEIQARKNKELAIRSLQQKQQKEMCELLDRTLETFLKYEGNYE